MSTASGNLAAALAAKDVDAAVTAFASLAGQPLDARTLAITCDLMARNRRNQQAWDAFEIGRTAHGVPKLIASGLSLNALMYACCRESSMLDKAMSVWELIGESSVKPDAEPAEKLLLANLSKFKYDDAFGVFLGMIDAGLQPSLPASTALVKTCGVMPRLAQSAYAVQMSMRAGGMDVSTELLAILLKACLANGTCEQSLALAEELEALGSPADANRISRLAIKCTEDKSNHAAKGAELLSKLRASATASASGGGAGGLGVGSAQAYEAVLAALTRSALQRTNPVTTQAAHGVLAELLAVGHTASPTTLTQLVTVACRTGQRRQALAAFRALTAIGGALEPTLAKALILTLGKSPGATSWHEVRTTAAGHGPSSTATSNRPPARPPVPPACDDDLCNGSDSPSRERAIHPISR